MFRSIINRVLGLTVAIVCAAPAAVALLKEAPFWMIDYFRFLYHPLWWWKWVWSWMPATRFKWESVNDVVSAIFGLAALTGIAVGLGVFIQKKRPQLRRKWEAEP
jgi:hypothetical protein